ncbi:MAG: hypothetical protein ACXVBG_23235 [Isosphaeraceae bacterium]
MFEPNEAFSIDIRQPALGFDERPAIAELDQILTHPDGYKHSYILELRKSHHSWGADAATAQIAAYIAKTALDATAGALATAAIVAFFRKVKALAGSMEDGFPDNPPTRDEMYERARNKISSVMDAPPAPWDGSPDPVVCVAEDWTPLTGPWSFVFQDATYRYVVNVALDEDLPLTTHLRRERLDGGTDEVPLR